MAIGPSENALNSQLVAQLQAGQDARVARPSPPPSPETPGRQQPAISVNRDVAGQGGRQATGRDSQTEVTARSAQRRDLVLRTPDPVFSDASDIAETESRVARLFNREAPAGRTSNQDAEPQEPLGQIVDIRV